MCYGNGKQESGTEHECEENKSHVKQQALSYWGNLLRNEASNLKSLKYFRPEFYSLSKPHYIWTSSVRNPYECSKSIVLARMISGRFRTFALMSHWSSSQNGECKAASCSGILSNLEHILVSCPTFTDTRNKLYEMMLRETEQFPRLHETIQQILASNDETVVTQFILEPLAFSEVRLDFYSFGDTFARKLAYITRTFAFSIHREYMKLLKLFKN